MTDPKDYRVWFATSLVRLWWGEVVSFSWVKAGALYALNRDYRDIGAQCGELAAKVLAGTPVSSLPPAAPRKVVYSVNLKTANHMKLEIAQALVDGAQQAFK
jgi:putative ABC transport system substrate-binding protein